MSLVPTSHRARPAFGGHEKFVFRQGWLKKTIDAVLLDPFIFSREESYITLGVGKNMAASMRYWGITLGLLEESRLEKQHKTQLGVTSLGNAIFKDGGWDPYLENIGTLWLLHWLLTNNQRGGLVWFLTFSKYFDIEFRKPALQSFITQQLQRMGLETTEGMVEREVDVFLRTYVPAQTRNTKGFEESLNCPMVNLNLLHFIPSESIYRFNVGEKSSLPTLIFGYALCSFLTNVISNRRTITVDECIYSPHSPGQVFKLDENSVILYLEELETMTKGALRVQETAGLSQVYLHSFSPSLGWDLLQEYYG